MIKGSTSQGVGILNVECSFGSGQFDRHQLGAVSQHGLFPCAGAAVMKAVSRIAF